MIASAVGTTNVVTFVGLAVAVVINAVAGFGRQFAAGSTTVAHVFIDDAIAVVIDEIADFLGWGDQRNTTCRSTDALPFADRTNT